MATDTTPRATTPQEIIGLFERFLGERDVDALVGLYEPDATFQTPDGVVTGHAAIRQVLEGFVALEPNLAGEIRNVLEADGSAVVVNEWQLEGTAPDGSPVRMGGQSADVMRRQPDGRWLILIDAPWGAGPR